MSSDDDKTRTKADILAEFLEVAFHSILYFRKVYPKRIFCLKKKYQIPIRVSKHPEVNEYITECVKTARELIRQEGLKQVALVIVTAEDVPLEKYCFDLVDSGMESRRDDFFVKTEEVFRDYLLRLSIEDGKSKELPEDCCFQIQMTTTEECSVRLNESVDQSHFPWIEADVWEDVERDFKILPVKTLNTALLSLNMYVER